MCEVIAGQSSRGRLWPMPSNTTSSAPGMAAAVAWPPLTSHILSSDPCLVVGPVQDQRGHAHGAQAPGPVTRGDGGHELPGGADRVVGPVVGPPGPVPYGRLVEREAR